MIAAAEHRELLSLLEHFEIDGFPVTVGGRPVVELVRELVEAPRLPADLVPVIEAVALVEETERAEREAYEARQAAELALAELVGTRRRDKDLGFDADFDARKMIVDAAMAAVRGDRDEPSGRD